MIVLIDLSIIFRRWWHSTEHEPVSEAFARTVAEVHKWAADGEHVAVCVDTPPYLRKELYPDYKAQREKAPAQMFGQLDAVKKRLADDGLLVVGAQGYEADDVIATFVKKLRDPGKTEITIISGDKDALQLVAPDVRVISPATGAVMDEAAVKEKYGVPPSLMGDYLALVGDKGDNIPGVDGVGPKTAANWLNECGSLGAVLENAESLMPVRHRSPVASAIATIKTARVLVELRTDAPIEVGAIFEKRDVKPLAVVDDEPEAEDEMPEPEVVHEEQPTTRAAPVSASTAIAVRNEAWTLALEPRDPTQAWNLSKHLYNARIFGKYESPEQIFGTIMTGRSFGLDAIASLRGFNIIQGKQTMSSSLMIGLVRKRTDVCKYFRLIESTQDSATWETWRVGEPSATRMTYTVAEAAAAGLTRPGKNGGPSQWIVRPATMCRHRSATELAHAVYQDVLAGLYSDDEMQDVR